MFAFSSGEIASVFMVVGGMKILKLAMVSANGRSIIGY